MSDGLNVPSMGNKNKRQRFADEMKVEVNKKKKEKQHIAPEKNNMQK